MRDLIATGFVSLIILICIIVITRLLAQGLGPEKFGAYSLARTVVKTIITFAILGMNVAIPRYLAFHSNNPEKQKAYIFYGSGGVLVISLFFILVSVVFPNTVGLFLFGRAQSRFLLYGTLILMIAHTLHMLTYAFFRGKLRMKYANLFQVLNIGLIPLFVALIWARTDAPTVLWAMGIATIAVIALPFLWQFIGSAFAINRSTSQEMKEIYGYSLPRVPADIGLGLMFVCGPWLAARMGDIREAGYFVVGQSVLNLISTILEAIGLVSLPYFARLSGSRERDALRAQVSVLIGFALHAGIFATVQLFIFADWITVLWCGPEYAPAIPLMRVILASAGAYALYVSVRGAIDADEVKAINTRNIWISLLFGVVVTVILYMLGLKTLSLAIGLSAGIGMLGLLSFVFLHKRFSLELNKYNLILLVLINLTMSVLALLFKYFVPLSKISIIYIPLLEFIFISIYIFILKLRKVFWVEIFFKKIMG